MEHRLIFQSIYFNQQDFWKYFYLLLILREWKKILVSLWNLSFNHNQEKWLKGKRILLTPIIEKFHGIVLPSDLSESRCLDNGHRNLFSPTLHLREGDIIIIHDQIYSWQNCSSSIWEMSQALNVENLHMHSGLINPYILLCCSSLKTYAYT